MVFRGSITEAGVEMERKTTKAILLESFLELARSKNIGRITIREISENCGYPPATFYRHFRDKDDLIAWDYAQHAGGILRQIVEDGLGLRQAILNSTRYFREHKGYLNNLFRHTSGHESFLRHMAEPFRRQLIF